VTDSGNAEFVAEDGVAGLVLIGGSPTEQRLVQLVSLARDRIAASPELSDFAELLPLQVTPSPIDIVVSIADAISKWRTNASNNVLAAVLIGHSPEAVTALGLLHDWTDSDPVIANCFVSTQSLRPPDGDDFRPTLHALVERVTEVRDRVLCDHLGVTPAALQDVATRLRMYAAHAKATPADLEPPPNEASAAEVAARPSESANDRLDRADTVSVDESAPSPGHDDSRTAEAVDESGIDTVKSVRELDAGTTSSHDVDQSHHNADSQLPGIQDGAERQGTATEVDIQLELPIEVSVSANRGDSPQDSTSQDSKHMPDDAQLTAPPLTPTSPPRWASGTEGDRSTRPKGDPGHTQKHRWQSRFLIHKKNVPIRKKTLPLEPRKKSEVPRWRSWRASKRTQTGTAGVLQGSAQAASPRMIGERIPVWITLVPGGTSSSAHAKQARGIIRALDSALAKEESARYWLRCVQELSGASSGFSAAGGLSKSSFSGPAIDDVALLFDHLMHLIRRDMTMFDRLQGTAGQPELVLIATAAPWPDAVTIDSFSELSKLVRITWVLLEPVADLFSASLLVDGTRLIEWHKEAIEDVVDSFRSDHLVGGNQGSEQEGSSEPTVQTHGI
jgi:hypothetical protein